MADPSERDRELSKLLSEQLGLGEHLGEVPENLAFVFRDDGSVEMSSPLFSKGRMVKSRFKYEGDRFFEIFCSETLAEALMNAVATEGFNPFRTFFEGWAVSGGKVTPEMKALADSKVVSGRILYGEIPTYREHVGTELEAINVARPDFETNEEAEARRAVETASSKGALPISAFRLKDSSRTLM